MHTRRRVKELRNRLWRLSLPLIAAALVCFAAVFAILAMRPTVSGETTLVATSDIAKGQGINQGNAMVILLPEQARPKGTLSTFPEQPAVTTSPVLEGEVLVEQHFSASNSGIPPGMSRVVVEIADQRASVHPGDLVQVWGPSEACTASESAIVELANNAVVEQVTEGTGGALQGQTPATIILLVPSSQVPGVLCASVQGTVHFVVSGQ